MRCLPTALMALLVTATSAAQQQPEQVVQPMPQSAAPSVDERPSPESLHKLFAVMHTNSLIDNIMAQIDSNARNMLMQSLAGKQLNETQRKIIQDSQAQLQALTKSELSWGELEPMVIQVYRENLTQSEVDGMVRFYQSESGRAVIAKMPSIMQEMMQKMQTHVQGLTPKIAELQKHTMAQLIEAADTQPAPHPPVNTPAAAPAPASGAAPPR
jgi:hypothetical protein